MRPGNLHAAIGASAAIARARLPVPCRSRRRASSCPAVSPCRWFALLGGCLAAFYTCLWAQGPSRNAAASSGGADSGRGWQLYRQHCAQCHGEEGTGDGPAADRLSPRPRDFSRGKFKLRSTESREAPADGDLFKTISEGMPGTSMPAWRHLGQRDLWALVQIVKGFSRRFAAAGAAPRKIRLEGRVPYSRESAAKGREVYVELECFKCHGREGRGDGPSAPDLEDEWGFSTRPTNLTRAWTFRGGSSAQEIFQRFIAGLDGTPMPSIASGFPMDEEVQEIQIKIEDEVELSAKERNKYDSAMKAIREKSWHLANYVRSLSPEKKPETRAVLRSRPIRGIPPHAIDDSRWADLEESRYPLAGQVMVEPRNFTPSVEEVSLKCMHTEVELACLVAWDDPSLSLEEPWDAMAVQFPVRLGDGPRRPHFLMGDLRNATYLWSFRADSASWEDSLAGGTVKVHETNAKGMTSYSLQPAERQHLSARATYRHGRYRLLVKRPLQTGDEDDLQFELGRFIPIAFSAWDGSHGESGTRRSISTWYSLILEKPGPPKPYLHAGFALVLAAALEILAVGAARRWWRQKPARTLKAPRRK